MSKLGIEDRIFTKARLGKHWTEARALDCLRFFGPAPYRFNAAQEQEFIDTRLTDYSDNLRGMLRTATQEEHEDQSVPPETSADY